MKEAAEQRSRTMRAVRSQDTSTEVAVRRALQELGHTGYRLHRRDLPGRPDIAFIGRRLAIFVNGCFWHGHNCRRGNRLPATNTAYWHFKIARNRDRDLANAAHLEELGWSVLTIWECELTEPMALREKLAAFLVSPLKKQN